MVQMRATRSNQELFFVENNSHALDFERSHLMIIFPESNIAVLALIEMKEIPLTTSSTILKDE